MLAEVHQQRIFSCELELWRVCGAHIVDVSEPWVYARGHVPGAKNIPLSQLLNVAQALKGPIVLICDQGDHSRRAVELLVNRGKRNTAFLAGGTRRYAQLGYRLE
jgi:rhodanese-related sulfurtransferase